ncbi:MAG: Uma2 family endonuclease [Chloroflexales bacterium]|nr:Uma2 family endonuclease [Chloroflexales bacterium]
MSATIAVDDLILQMDASGIPVRMEYVRGRMKWEASPASRHQRLIDRIRATIQPQSGNPWACDSLTDVLIRFNDPDQSLKRPDIAIFCAVQPDQDTALTTIPDAVLEVLSVGYEAKDLGPDGAPFYIANGVRDVLVVNPHNNTVIHYQPGAPEQTTPLPCTVALACGCQLTIPAR